MARPQQRALTPAARIDFEWLRCHCWSVRLHERIGGGWLVTVRVLAAAASDWTEVGMTREAGLRLARDRAEQEISAHVLRSLTAS